MKKNLRQFKFLNLAFFLGLFLLFLIPPTDPDLGWHLRCGQKIWQEHNFCSQNQFSVLLANYQWVNHYWLYQTVIWGVWELWGIWGLTLINGLLLAAAFFLFYQAVKGFELEKILASLLAIFLSWGVFSFGIRSQIFSFFFFSLILFLNSKFRQKAAYAAFCPIILLLWANTHGGSVVLGLVLLSFFFLKESLAFPKKTIFFIFIFLLSIAATFINPFGLKIYEEAWRHLASVPMGQLIAEWAAPTPLIWWLIFFSGLWLFFYLLLNEKVQDKIPAFLILAFAFLSLKARRNLPFYFSLATYLFLISALTQKILSSFLKKKETLRDGLSYLIVILFFSYGLLFQLPQTLAANLSWKNFCQAASVSYPGEAVQFLKEQKRGNIFNRYEWGGFLIWQLPEYKIFVDGRMPAWLAEAPLSGAKAARYISPYTIYLETLQTQPGWQETLKDYNINWILISPGTFMDINLRPAPEKFGWKEVYRDKISVVYQREGADAQKHEP